MPDIAGSTTFADRVSLDAAPWDAVVIGAGPAGAVSAHLLARRGWRVLLLERAAWPRTKVCGGCINAAAIGMLRSIGLGSLVKGAPALDYSVLAFGRRTATVHQPAGAAITRREFDAGLVHAFCEAGGTFADRASAIVSPESSSSNFRKILVTRMGQTQAIRARVVLACDGIAGASLEQEPWARWQIPADAWFGVAATLPAEALRVVCGGMLMNLGNGGYVGLVREAAGTVHLAAALDGRQCKQAGGPARFVQGILADCGHGGINLDQIKFTGTGLLTRSRRALGGHRVLTVGDACGYVEPFTGEGIAWAIRSAIDVVELVSESEGTWLTETPQLWKQRHRSGVGRQQRACRMIRFALHRPMLARTGVMLAAMLPRAADAVARLTQSHGQSFIAEAIA